MSLDNTRDLPEHLDCWIVSRDPFVAKGAPCARYVIWGVADDEVGDITVHHGNTAETPEGEYGSNQKMRDSIVRHMQLGPQAIAALQHLVRQVEGGGPVDLGEAKRLIAESSRPVTL
jgi:hypothetical protein